MAVENSRIFKLLDHAVSNGRVFLPDDKYANQLVEECLKYFNRDNVCTTISNSNGVLCSTYPVQLIIPLHQKEENEDGTTNNSCKMLLELIAKGRFARTRGRFPIPVLLLGDKYVCRSSTLAHSAEVYSRIGYQYLFPGDTTAELDNENVSQMNGAAENDSENNLVFISKSNTGTFGKPVFRNGTANGKQVQQQNAVGQPVNGTKEDKEWLIDKMRNKDIDILNELKVNMICDFMVENKKVKFGMYVTSSEKVDSSNRYSEFTLMSIPYPGCEFFTDYTNNNYTGVGLQFDWKQTFIDAELKIPDEILQLLNIEWKDYIQWDLVTLTKNYLKLLLQCLLRDSTTGILTHCISGWDRTPLFISLLRLSLWADGLIHQSLNAEEMVYLTLAYDWFLFSHQFSDRINKSEEIMRFCFDFLKLISGEEYSVLPLIEGKKNPFLCTSNETDEVFVLENVFLTPVSDNEIDDERNCPTVRNGEFEELSHSMNCSNGLHAWKSDHLENCNDSLSDFQEVRTCVNCMISDIAGFTEEGRHQCGEKQKLRNSDQENGLISSVAVLPLTCSEFSVNVNSSPENEAAGGTCHMCNATVSPRSALSSSFETAKAHICDLQQDTSKSETMQNGMSSSLSYLKGGLDHPRSEPISVPSSGKTHLINDVVHCSSASSSPSAALGVEPGSSWQLVSSPSFQDSPCGLEAPSSASSSAMFPHNSSSKSLVDDSNVLKHKLMKRREKLNMASNIVIPEYCAVIQKQKLRLQQEGSFSSFMGTLVGMVKGT